MVRGKWIFIGGIAAGIATACAVVADTSKQDQAIGLLDSDAQADAGPSATGVCRRVGDGPQLCPRGTLALECQPNDDLPPGMTKCLHSGVYPRAGHGRTLCCK